MKKLIVLSLLGIASIVSVWAAETAKKPENKPEAEIQEIVVKPANVQITKVDLGFDNLFYYVDRQACVCWVRHSQVFTTYSLGFGVAVVDCKKLAVYTELKDALKRCL